MAVKKTKECWIYLVFFVNGLASKGIDIGYKCDKDTECHAGNGGQYSTCNKWFSVCTCTINEDREGQTFLQDRSFFDCPETSRCNVSVPGSCTDCIPKDALKFKDSDWYGPERTPPFGAQFIRDAPTAVCYEPDRAKKSSPTEYIHVKESDIAGLGAFASKFLPIGTVFGPYKGIKPTDRNIPERSIEKSRPYAWIVSEEENITMTNTKWVDAVDPARSNYVRYVSTPSTMDQENTIKIQYAGEVYYMTIRGIPAGTELAVWYGDAYGQSLGIRRVKPYEFTANVGYVNSKCTEKWGNDCTLDKNAVCRDNWCVCKPGSNIRAGKCIYDETAGGICSDYDGSTCKNDSNAVCMKGVCVCKRGTWEKDGVCEPESSLQIEDNGDPHLEDSACEGSHCVCKDFAMKLNISNATDEMAGGKCKSSNMEQCKLDPNAQCINGVCICKDGFSVIDGLCKEDETLRGRCYLRNVFCKKVPHSLCVNGRCRCDDVATAVGDECVLKESARGACAGSDGADCKKDKNAFCQGGRCVCKDNTSLVNGECIAHESYNGICTGRNGADCKVDTNAECIDGRCQCKYGSSPVGKTCVKYGAAGGRCAGEDGTVCKLDPLAICTNGTCICNETASASVIDGVCKIRETYGAICLAFEKRTCFLDKNAECIGYICQCKKGTYPVNGKCMKNETAGGLCTRNGKSCAVDKNAVCVDGVCECKPTASEVKGVCVLDETLGGVCTGDNEKACKLDENAICINSSCVCKKGSRPVGGRCIQDETFGGKCKGENGTPCKIDQTTICMKGRCVLLKLEGRICTLDDPECTRRGLEVEPEVKCSCRPGTSLRAGSCVPDETLNGRCYGREGDPCRKDVNTVCQNGYCKCKENATSLNGVCYEDEAYGGRCSGEDGTACLQDQNAECYRGVCDCKYQYLPVQGKCTRVGGYGGFCDARQGCPVDKNAKCVNARCVCKPSTRPYNGRCVHDDEVHGNCRSQEGSECLLDSNAVCVNGVCQCKPGMTIVNGKCAEDVVSCDASKQSACSQKYQKLYH